MHRFNTTARYQKIEQMTDSLYGATFEHMQEYLGVSRAALRRDIQFMRETLNMPIVCDRDTKRYTFDKSKKRDMLPRAWFSAEEASALLMMQSLIKDIQPSLNSRIAPLQNRLTKLIESKDFDAGVVSEKIKIVATAKRRTENDFFETLAAAALNGKRVIIKHHNRSRNEVLDREVSPQQMLCHDNNWYLVAICHLRGKLLRFGLDVILGATVLDTDTEKASDEDLEKESKGFGIFGGNATETATLKFSPFISQWVKNEFWHDDQVATMGEDGSLTLEVPFSNSIGIIAKIMQYGANVEVVSPAPLRESVVAEMKKAIAQYN